MNNEEEIVKYLKECIEHSRYNFENFGENNYLDKSTQNAIQGLLDLYIIEKEKNRQNKMRIVQLENEITARIEDINKDFISKDKIREALGIEEDVSEEKLLSLLETLMSEVDRLEDIEDKKVEVDYERVFAKGVKSVKDKIREKALKYEQMKKKLNKATDIDRIKSINERLIELQEILLEEE